MGLDLTLMPFDSPPGCEDRIAYSHTLLDCERRRDLFGLISKLPSTPVPKRFTTFMGRQRNGEHGYGNTQKDPYGTALGYVFARDLRTLKKHEGVKDNPKNKAVWAYLASIGPKAKIALYWH